jgi:hypothetical protein
VPFVIQGFTAGARARGGNGPVDIVLVDADDPGRHRVRLGAGRRGPARALSSPVA